MRSPRAWVVLLATGVAAVSLVSGAPAARAAGSLEGMPPTGGQGGTIALPPTTPNYSPAEQRAFVDFEAQAAEFTGEQREFRKTLVDIVKRDYQHQKRDMQAKYQAELATLDKEAEAQRMDAIAVLRAFLASYPTDPAPDDPQSAAHLAWTKWTPDVEFRLALLTFDEETRAKVNGAAMVPTTLPTVAASQPAVDTNYPQTIALLLDLIRRFPHYRFIDQAEFSLGYAIDPTETSPQAMPYFRAVVCPNKYSPYDPAPLFVGDEQYAEAAQEHRRAPSPPPPLPADVYDGCIASDVNSPVAQETWIRIGEFHFDNTGQLAAAEQAYQHAADISGDQYGFAVYKLGWTYFRDNRYKDAVAQFDKDIVWSDAQVKEGKDASETRPEAVAYIAFSFWQQASDGGSPGYSNMDQFYAGRWKEPHVREVYLGLATLYNKLGQHVDAAHTYELVEQHWPWADDAPQIQETLAEEYDAAHDPTSATAAREKLGELYGRDSQWAAHNQSDPEAIEQAQDLARNSLLIGADDHRKNALRALDAAQTERNKATLLTDEISAVEEFTYAAAGYGDYVRRYPNAPDDYKVHYYLGESYDGAGGELPAIGPAGYATLLEQYQGTQAAAAASAPAASAPVAGGAPGLFDPDYGKQLRADEEAAADQYEWVRDHRALAPPDFDKTASVADYACSARETLVRTDQTLGLFTVPPKPDNGANKPALPIQPQPMPDDVRKLIADYDLFAKAYPNDKTTPPKMFDAAVYFYDYLRWDDEKNPDGSTSPGARTRFASIREAYCGKAKEADEAGETILGSYVIQNDLDMMDHWVKQLKAQQCGADLSKNTELAGIEAGVTFKRAADVMKKGQCGDPNAPMDVADCDAAAKAFEELAKEYPDYPHAGQALQNAAIAYEKNHEYNRAIALYEELFDPKGPYAKSKEVNVADAIYFAAFDHQRFFEFDDALREYRYLFDPKYRGNEYQLKAMISAAVLEQGLENYDDAADLYKRIADMPGVKPLDGVDAYQSAARCYQDANQQSLEMGTLRSLVDRARALPPDQGGDYVVRAEFREAEIAEQDHDQGGAQTLYKKVVSDYKALALPPTGAAAEYAAHAFFTLALEDYTSRYKKTLYYHPDDPNAKHAQKTIADNEKAALACQRSFIPLYYNAFSPPPDPSKVPPPEVAFTRPTWMFAGWYMSGQCWQDVGDLYQNAPLPSWLGSQPQEVQDAFTNGLNGGVTKYDNAAQSQWKTLLSVAAAAHVSNDWTQRATKQMNSYDPADYPLIKDAKVGLALTAPAQ